MKSLYFLFFFMLAPALIWAQDKEVADNNRTEIGLNITNTLAGFFNSGGDALPKDKYLFSLKFSHTGGAVRFGMNFSTRNSTEFLPTGTRDLSENNVFLRAGYERRNAIGHNFTVYYGFDVLAEREFERNTFDNFTLGRITSRKTKYGFGAGPVLGIQYELMKNIALSTEASIYGIYGITQDYQELGGGLEPNEDLSLIHI